MAKAGLNVFNSNERLFFSSEFDLPANGLKEINIKFFTFNKTFP